MPQRAVIPGGFVQVPPTRPILPGGFTQVPFRPVLGGVAQIGGASGVAEVTEVDFNTGSVVAGSGFPGTSFLISGATERYCVWFNTEGEVQPNVVGATAYLEVVVSDPNNPATVASECTGPLLVAFASSQVNGVLTITDLQTGPRVAAVDVDTGATITVITPGS